MKPSEPVLGARDLCRRYFQAMGEEPADSNDRALRAAAAVCSIALGGYNGPAELSDRFARGVEAGRRIVQAREMEQAGATEGEICRRVYRLSFAPGRLEALVVEDMFAALEIVLHCADEFCG